MGNIGLCDIPHYIDGDILYIYANWYLSDDNKYGEDNRAGLLYYAYKLHNCSGLDTFRYYYWFGGPSMVIGDKYVWAAGEGYRLK